MDSLAAVPSPLWFVIAAAFGLVFGSFVTALSYRLPRGESIANGRSRCPACGHVLMARDLVPVFSWIFHKGACSHCGASVSWRYPLIELTSAALFVAAVMFAQGTVHLGLLLAMTPVMVALAVIDIEHERLPNNLVVVLAALSAMWRWTGDGDLLTGGALATAVLVLGILIDKAYEARKGHGGLGLGDVKLMATGALALPLGPFLLFMTMAGLLGVMFGAIWQRATQSKSFPFGPAILASLWICLASGPGILRRLESLLSG